MRSHMVSNAAPQPRIYPQLSWTPSHDSMCACLPDSLPQVGRRGLQDYKAAVVADMSEGGVFGQGLTSLLM